MTRPLLQVIGVTKDYQSPAGGVHHALRGVDLAIHENEVISLLGVNGAGKSTLSNIIATLHPCTSGQILYQGVSIYQQLAHYRQAVGFCPQRPNVNPHLTIRQNLIFAGLLFGADQGAARQRALELMQEFNLELYADHKINALSGGYRQRFMIARALVQRPRIVILDEPTVALDPHVRHQIWGVISGLKAVGVSVLLTTHYLEEAERLSDRVCLLHDGAIRLVDSPENLKARFAKDDLEGVFLSLVEEGL